MRGKQLGFWSLCLVGLICVYASLYLQNLYMLRVAVLAVLTAILAVSVNLLVGYTGQISLGHAGFYGIGAYTVGLLTINLHWSFWISLLVAVLVSSLMGFILGLPTTNLKGHFLGIATLGFGVIINVVLNNWMQLTNGPQGIRGIPSPQIFGISLHYQNYFLSFSLACLLLIVLLVYWLIHSAVGRAWRCIRQDEITAHVVGIHVYRYKLLAFTLSGGIAGLAGALFAGYMTFISPDTFDLNQSIAIITTTILGGAGTLGGPLLGTAILTVLSEWLRNFDELRLVIYGAILVLVIVFIPEGIYPFLQKHIRHIWAAKKEKSEKALQLKKPESKERERVLHE